MPLELGRRLAGRALLLLLLLALAAEAAAATPRIGVLTIGPGQEYWSRFGHNALLVDRGDGQPTVYNYGYFDFEQPGFLLRFLRGRMLYKVVDSTLAADLGYYAEEGRGVQLQWLRLAPAKAAALADYLAWNVRAENADYRYDYFLANCSTRVRDAIDRALDGELRRQTDGRSRGLSFRSEALRLSAGLPWMYYGIHLLLGVESDRPISRWAESFVPERLHDALTLVVLADGAPLVAEEHRLLAQQLPASPAEEPRFAVAAGLLGLALAAIAWHGRQAARLGRVARFLLGGFCLLGGLSGLLMLALWLGTDHRAAWANRNLLLCNPLLLALLPLCWRGVTAPASRAARTLAQLLLLGAAAAVAMHFLPLQGQDSLEWILLLLPLHLALWRYLTAAAPPPANAG